MVWQQVESPPTFLIESEFLETKIPKKVRKNLLLPPSVNSNSNKCFCSVIRTRNLYQDIAYPHNVSEILAKRLRLGNCPLCVSNLHKISEELEDTKGDDSFILENWNVNNKGCICFNTTLKNDVTKYYKSYNGIETNVSKAAFSKLKGRVLVRNKGDKLVRIILKNKTSLDTQSSELIAVGLLSSLGGAALAFGCSYCCTLGKKLRGKMIGDYTKLQSVVSAVEVTANNLNECAIETRNLVSKASNVILNAETKIDIFMSGADVVVDIASIASLVGDFILTWYYPKISLLIHLPVLFYKMWKILKSAINPTSRKEFVHFEDTPMSTLYSQNSDFRSPSSSISETPQIEDQTVEEFINSCTVAWNLDQVAGTMYDREFNMNETQSKSAAIFYSAMSVMLPKSVFSVIKNANVFTSSKIADDEIVFPRFISLIRQGIDACLEAVNNSALKLAVNKFLAHTPLSTMSLVIPEMHDLIVLYKTKPSSVFHADIVYRIMQTKKMLTQSEIEGLWTRNKNLALQSLIDTFTILWKKVKANTDLLRDEPACFVFCGPPGCGKTITSSALVEYLTKKKGITAYIHTVPAVAEGKDFYDMYENQDLFVMDDVGQKGVHQWASIINMVSCQKLGLSCAAVEQKGTKFFTSDTILVTTNNFESIRPREGDGIQDIGALHRRGVLFDFGNLKSNGHGVVKGIVKMKWYSTVSKSFIDGYPPQLVAYMEAKGKPLPAEHDYNPFQDFLVWVLQVMETYTAFKREKQVNTFAKLDYDAIYNEMQSLSDYSFLSLYSEYMSSFPLKFDLLKSAKDTFCAFKMNNPTAITIALCSGLATALCVAFATWIKMKVVVLTPQAILYNYKKILENQEVVVNNNSCNAIQKNVRVITLTVDGRQSQSTCVLSGKFILMTSHSIAHVKEGNTIYVTVYENIHNANIQYDQVPVSVVASFVNDDLVVLALPSQLPTYARTLKKFFDKADGVVVCNNSKDQMMITPLSVVKIGYVFTPLIGTSYADNSGNTGFVGSISETDIGYAWGGEGLCGAIIANSSGSIMGMHVAGKDNIRGYSKIWRPFTIFKLNEILNSASLTINYEVDTPAKYADLSVVKLITHGIAASVVKDHTIAPSRVDGIFENTRSPANLTSLGPGTIKEMVRGSYAKVGVVRDKYLAFAIDCAHEIILPFSKMTSEEEIVNGNDKLKRINKDSSSGYGYKKDKNLYLDWEKGIILPPLRQAMDALKQQIISKELKVESVLFQDQLKVELRNDEKIDKPRVFKMSPLALTVLYREYFGNMLSQIHDKKLETGMSVGINPFKHWNTLENKAISMGNNCFDGDFAAWDKTMLSQFQFALNSVILANFITDDEHDKQIAEFLLTTIIYTFTLNMNEVVVTTHSCPSGVTMTADYNSLINKMYGSYIFASLWDQNNPGEDLTLFTYFRLVYDAVYGDDKLVFVQSNIKSWFNGPSFAVEAAKLGLTFTPADKGEWTYTTKPLDECSFLKRGFKYHRQIGDVVAPLEERSMLSTINWVSDFRRNDELTAIKLYNFQREAFLHEDTYSSRLQRMKEFTSKRGIIFTPLTDSYLVKLYLSDPDAYGEGINHTFSD